MVYFKYFLVVAIVGLVAWTLTPAGKTPASVASCSGPRMKQTFEMLFPIDGQVKNFRTDLVLRNEDIEALEDQRGSLGEPTIKLTLTTAGKNKLAKGSSEAVGQAAAFRIGGEIKGTILIRNTISSGELNLSLTKGLNADNSIITFTAADFCPIP